MSDEEKEEVKGDYDDAVEGDNDDNAMLSALTEALSRASRNTKTKPEWDGDQTTFKDFVFRFSSWCNRNKKTIHPNMLNPDHAPKPSERERMFHELVGMLTLGASGKANRALDILKGYVVMLAGGAIAWRSRLQRHVATSTGGAEYIAAYECGVDVAALSQILAEMGFPQTSVPLHEDSSTCITMTESNTISDAHKALQTRYHWLRERVADGTLRFIKIGTTEQCADFLTKPLGFDKFDEHVKHVMGER